MFTGSCARSMPVTLPELLAATMSVAAAEPSIGTAPTASVFASFQYTLFASTTTLYGEPRFVARILSLESLTPVVPEGVPPPPPPLPPVVPPPPAPGPANAMTPTESPWHPPRISVASSAVSRQLLKERFTVRRLLSYRRTRNPAMVYRLALGHSAHRTGCG